MKRYRVLIAWVPLLYTLGVTGFLLFGPVYASRTTSSSGAVLEESTKTLLDVNGARVLLILAVPILIASVPLMAQRFRQRSRITLIATVLMLGFVIISGLSIGLLYFPAVVALALATDAAGKATADATRVVATP